MARARILILGGTGEGFRIAERLSCDAGIDVVSSMAGRTPAPKVPAGALRRGGFGGPEGLAAYLKTERITAVIDATHPFAAQMSRNAAVAGKSTGVPTVHVWREGWRRQTNDDWREVATMAEAVAVLPKNAGVTFLTTGKTQLHHFAPRRDVAFLARVVAPLRENENIGMLPHDLKWIYSKGPFDVEGERNLLKDHDVQWIVSKNSGGEAAYAKLIVAREAGIPVIMVQRPDAPDGRCVADAVRALEWLEDEVALTIRNAEGVGTAR